MLKDIDKNRQMSLGSFDNQTINLSKDFEFFAVGKMQPDKLEIEQGSNRCDPSGGV